MVAAEAAVTPKILFVATLMLVAAVVGIRLARVAHVPRVVGYLVLGIALKVVLQAVTGSGYATNPIPLPAQDALGVVKSFALALILFEIGAAFDKAHLKSLFEHVWKMSLCEIGLVGGGVFFASWVAILVFEPELGRIPIIPLFLAFAAIETAPAATMLVLRQYDAKGPLTDHIIAMTGMNNLTSIVLFFVAFLLLGEFGFIHAEHLKRGLIPDMLMVTVGSALIGCLLGLGLSLLHMVLTRFETVLVFLAIMLAVSSMSKMLGVNSLIICMFMGLLFVNFSVQTKRFQDEINSITAPVFALFFVIAGFNLELHLLLEVGVVGLAFLLARAFGKFVGAGTGVRWVGPEHRVPRYIGGAMMCQAGVAIALGKYLTEHWGQTQADGNFIPHPHAEVVNTVILASVVVFELTGPLAVKRALVKAGEVKAVTLLSRRPATAGDARTVWVRLRHLLQSAPTAGGPRQQTSDLTARHVMRTNVETLSDSATMSQVMRFVERSRFNHFFVVNEDGRLVGTIDYRDLRGMVFNPVLARFLKAYDMANTAPPVVVADEPLRFVLDAFHRYDVGSLPVIDNEENQRLLGIIEQRDVLRALHQDEDGEEDEGSAH